VSGWLERCALGITIHPDGSHQLDFIGEGVIGAVEDWGQQDPTTIWTSAARGPIEVIGAEVDRQVRLGQPEQVFGDGVGLGLHGSPCHANTLEWGARGFDFLRKTFTFKNESVTIQE
jgi:hypothetical protein